MTDKAKPKEYWISPGVEAWQTDEVVMNPACVKEHHIHVIEFAALTEAQEKIVQLRKQIETMRGLPLHSQMDEAQAEVARLREALKFYTQFHEFGERARAALEKDVR